MLVCTPLLERKNTQYQLFAEFLNKCQALPIGKQIRLAQRVVIKRSAFKVIKQRILHLLR